MGIDDELKNDVSSVYTTPINSSFFPVPTPVLIAAAPVYEYQQYAIEAVAFTQRINRS